jgi:hypothetical protein
MPQELLVNYLDGEGWHLVSRERAINILSVFHSPDYIHKALRQGEPISIQFGDFQTMFIQADSIHLLKKSGIHDAVSQAVARQGCGWRAAA